eukprot:TRINITY_DN19913_c0_g1_i2.p1 TRINITY_DN19913_c0_g1~~TRINITY_DN19913_c0_g1_i2.p1  ORF type:complete len:227 (+),score=52.37 TRINITY_DN19913_c0_g1_i2:82-762(+)
MSAAGPGSGDDVPGPEKITAQTISQDPEMVLFTDFLSQEEVDYLLALCEGRWQQSKTTVGEESNLYVNAGSSGEAKGEDTTSEVRTSTSVYLKFDESIVVERIAARVAAVARNSLENVEPLVALKYEPGQYFKVHHDGSFRQSTVFVYFNDVEEGGETLFPNLGVKILPKARTALMWHNRLPDGEGDMRLMHEALPVLKGQKYGMNCFVGASAMRDASHVVVTQLG